MPTLFLSIPLPFTIWQQFVAFFCPVPEGCIESRRTRYETSSPRNTLTMLRTNGPGLAALLLLTFYGIINGMGKSAFTTGRYQLTSTKLTAPVTVAVVADLHNTQYGERQSELIAGLREGAPDVVAFVGDAFHAQENERHTLDALKAISAEFPQLFRYRQP